MKRVCSSLLFGFGFVFLFVLFITGNGGSSYVVGTDAAASCENIPPLMFIAVMWKVCGWGHGVILSPNMSCLFQV